MTEVESYIKAAEDFAEKTKELAEELKQAFQDAADLEGKNYDLESQINYLERYILELERSVEIHQNSDHREAVLLDFIEDFIFYKNRNDDVRANELLKEIERKL